MQIAADVPAAPLKPAQVPPSKKFFFKKKKAAMIALLLVAERGFAVCHFIDCV